MGLCRARSSPPDEHHLRDQSRITHRKIAPLNVNRESRTETARVVKLTQRDERTTDVNFVLRITSGKLVYIPHFGTVDAIAFFAVSELRVIGPATTLGSGLDT